MIVKIKTDTGWSFYESVQELHEEAFQFKSISIKNEQGCSHHMLFARSFEDMDPEHINTFVPDENLICNWFAKEVRPAENMDRCKILHLCFKDGTKKHVACNLMVFLLNDEGKTIERL